MNKRLASTNSAMHRSRSPRLPPVELHRPNRFHRFLKRLRAGGRSNMYGAIPYLMQAFALDRETAFHIVCEWMDQQSAAPPARAAEASSRR